jgi:hypothetical protein
VEHGMSFFSWLFGDGANEQPAATPPAVPATESGRAGSPVGLLTDAEAGDLARRHGVSASAIEEIASALRYSGGRLAQFNHPELGGMGQWMSGGMLMIGDMFNNELKAKVDRICRDVASALADVRSPTEQAATPTGRVGWWPEGLGVPAAAGAQNSMRYAFFPASNRLVIDDNGAVSIYDTGSRYLIGVSQQQSSRQALSFTDTDGRVVSLGTLERVSST